MVKKCYLCGVTKTFKHLSRKICSRCFVRLVEQRVRKGLGRVFSKGENVLVVGELADYFLKRTVKDFPLKIMVKAKLPAGVSKFDKIMVEETMDGIEADFLAGFFSPSFELKENKKVIKILKTITDEEAVKFAKIKGLRFKVNGKNKKIKDFLKKLSKKHPEIRYNLLKNVAEVEKVL